jgi:hypothetical protein
VRRAGGGRPEVIFAEPVGSCVDLAATVLRPLLVMKRTIRVAPLTVLVDPRAVEMTAPGNADVAYCSATSWTKPTSSASPRRMSAWRRRVRRPEL